MAKTPSNPVHGKKLTLKSHPELAATIKSFGMWLEAVKKWLTWTELYIPDNLHASRAEVLELLSVTPSGLQLLESLKLDIYPEGRMRKSHTEYDVKKLLRAVVALPTIARQRGAKSNRKKKPINATLKIVIDDILNGRTDLDSISDWKTVKKGK